MSNLFYSGEGIATFEGIGGFGGFGHFVILSTYDMIKARIEYGIVCI